MATNRRNRSGIVRLGPFCLAVWACGFLCLSGLGYVWHRNRNAQLSRELHRRSAHLEWVRKQNQQLDQVLEELRSPRALQSAIQKWQLGLIAPEQVLSVVDAGHGSRAVVEVGGGLAGGLGGAVASKGLGGGVE